MTTRPRAAIVDYGMGNLFSARQAADRAGFDAVITAAADEVLAADAVVLPGMGAFGDAMATLRELHLVEVLQRFAASGRAMMGVCLGMQLLMTRGFEFGDHEGLGLVSGEVIRIEEPRAADGRVLKVPHVGWTGIFRPHAAAAAEPPTVDVWAGTPLASIADGEYMYFVHSYHVVPADPRHVLSVSRYGHVEFCSSVKCGAIFAAQYHPERSGPAGLNIYRAFATSVGATAGQDPAPRTHADWSHA